MASGETGAKIAFETVFSRIGGSLLMMFIVISCLGTLNGLMLGCVRGIYALAARDWGPAPKVFKQVDPVTNMPVNSCIFGLMMTASWLLYFYGANLTEPWFGSFCFDTSELPVVTIYASYIPIFFHIFKDKKLPFAKRFLAPALAVCGGIFMVVAACFSHRTAVIYYLIVFAVIMAIGASYLKKIED